MPTAWQSAIGVLRSRPVMKRPVELSVVVEWENVLLSEEDRCFQMLRQLRKQLSEIAHTAEVIVLFNPKQIGRPVIESVLRDTLELNGSDSSVDLRLEEAEGKHYYSLKNEGAARAHGDIVIFVDSDVMPEDHWLKEISQPFFDHPGVGVVAGHTYLAHQSLREKAFALGWFFPLRNGENTFHSSSPRFFANNVAFRRDIIQQNPFPNMVGGSTRGACTQLARKLTASGISIWTNTAARANHPPPSDLQHYFIRAFAHGRDNILKWNAAGWP